MSADKVTKVTGGRWEKTRLCGCGECQGKPGVCPEESSPKARWLWGTVYDKDPDVAPVVDADGVDIDSWD